MITTTTKKVKFDREAKANLFIKLIQHSKFNRISGYGYDCNSTEPYWINVTTLAYDETDNITETELTRWKACGKLRF